jgi:hypothetical protein
MPFMLIRRATGQRCSRRAWWIGLLGFAACAQSAPGAHDDELAAQWRALRSRRGHFDGAPFDPEIDLWQGRKHVLMQQLAARALASRQRRPALIASLGTPDADWPAGSPAQMQALREAQWESEPPVNAAVLAYDWRAQRDRLVIALDGDRVAAIGWWLAYER